MRFKKNHIITTAVTVFIIFAIIALICYRHAHRNDHKYWINHRSGVIHNYRCRHFDGKLDDQLTDHLPDAGDTFYRDCRICGGRRPK